MEVLISCWFKLIFSFFLHTPETTLSDFEKRTDRFVILLSVNCQTKYNRKIFGQDVLADPEPFGLKRMTKEEWPDQWPAVVDAWADVLLSDEGEIAKVRPVLKQTQMEYLKLGLAYDASVHGWTANAFHTQLDGSCSI